jgi:hypothetical protein
MEEKREEEGALINTYIVVSSYIFLLFTSNLVSLNILELNLSNLLDISNIFSIFLTSNILKFIIYIIYNIIYK